MITAITDLKNNKRQSKDVAIYDKTSSYRKILGRIKSIAPSMIGRSSTSDSLKIPLQDILDAETKGRWWIVGGTWVGKQHSVAKEDTRIESNRSIGNESSSFNEKEQKLLKLAAKQRMNNDLRRSIFCIIMGSDDYQDAFEKIVRSEMLRGKSEREVVRVLVHCCGTEKSYNPFYCHLAKRICEYQNKCKFTFQLTFWDSFKQFDEMKARKAANLAKLLAELLKDHILNINVLKVIDISPNDMSESALIFLTILFSNIFETLDDTSAVNDLFKRGEPSLEHLQKKAEELEDDNILETSGREALKENIQLFLMHYLQNSPKNTKNSSFRKNLKAAIKACETDSLDYMM
jgi:nucleolar MIF4G domain-containing protein 1